MKIFSRVVSSAIIFVIAGLYAPSIQANPSPDPLQIIKEMEAAYSGVDDYTATFIKKERVNGEVLPEEHIFLKFKKPFKVYMKWLKGPHDGREAMYVQGRYDNKVIGHEGGFIGFVTMHMKPTGSLAMKGNRHPITDVGIGRLIEIVDSNLDRALKSGELKISYIGEEETYGRKTWHVVGELPEKKENPYYCAKMDLWVDEQLKLPIKIDIYGWKNELLESYGYKDLKINPGLKDEEFDEGYKQYDF